MGSELKITHLMIRVSFLGQHYTTRISEYFKMTRANVSYVGRHLKTVTGLL